MSKNDKPNTDGFHMDVLEAVQKNNAETYLIGLDQYKGANLINLRLGITSPKTGVKTLSYKGIALHAEHLRAIRAALEKAEQEAVKRGWLEAEAA